MFNYNSILNCHIPQISDNRYQFSTTASFCATFLLQTFLYCHAGEQLKQQVRQGHLPSRQGQGSHSRLMLQGQELSEAACRAPWLRAHPALVPGLHLVALDCRRCFVVRGGPFFTLSLEFFASVVGAVITYLVVLLQIK